MVGDFLSAGLAQAARQHQGFNLSVMPDDGGWIASVRVAGREEAATEIHPDAAEATRRAIFGAIVFL